MPQVLVQLSDAMLAELEKVAPASSRRRSRFIRLAIERALMDRMDEATREAYRAMPDSDEDVFDRRVWDEWRPQASRTTRRPRKAR